MNTVEGLSALAWGALSEVLDPELGINVVDLGLVYGLDVADGRVCVRLTMTTAACPLSDELVHDAQTRLRALPGVEDVRIELVWDPPWTPALLSPAAKLTLGWK
jgi:metal-sulfur cluster biosynthetic enzyme